MKKIYIFTASLALLFGLGLEASAHKGKRGAFGLKVFDKVDQNDDNKVSLSEFNQFHNERFQEMDADSNSEVSLDELMNFMRSKKEARNKS